MFTNALDKNQPDRSYYKSLYKFDPKTELALYNIPSYGTQGSLNKSMLVNERSRKLPPLKRQSNVREESAKNSEEYSQVLWVERIDEQVLRGA